VIPLPVILVEFLLAFGAALFIAQAVALVQLRRDGNWPPTRPVGSPEGAGAPAATDRRSMVPSRARILTLLAIGLGVSLWSLATLVTQVSL
jgi:hypothetical protein